MNNNIKNYKDVLNVTAEHFKDMEAGEYEVRWKQRQKYIYVHFSRFKSYLYLYIFESFNSHQINILVKFAQIRA